LAGGAAERKAVALIGCGEAPADPQNPSAITMTMARKSARMMSPQIRCA
jgi:hypothetical protein